MRKSVEKSLFLHCIFAVGAKKTDAPIRYLVARGSECDDGGGVMLEGIKDVSACNITHRFQNQHLQIREFFLSGVLFTPQVSECLNKCKAQAGCSVFSFWRERDGNNRCRWEKSAYVGRCKNIKSEELADLYAIPQGHCSPCLLLQHTCM